MTTLDVVLDDRYEVTGRLGRGGAADVLRAHDRVRDRDVALKVLRAETSGVTDRARFADEAQTLAGLDHPGLVSLLDAGVDGEQPFLVMELVEGENLAERLTTSVLPSAAVVGLGIRIAEGLAYAHARGIVHRDVKPANVLLDVAGNAQLSDFGIARLLARHTSHTRTGHTLGTPAYLAPEQVAGEKVCGAADVYALGLVLLEALTGERAFQGTAVEVAMARLQTGPVIPTSLGSGWVQLLAAMTARDPNDRPSAAQVADLLRAEPGETGRAVDTIDVLAFAAHGDVTDVMPELEAAAGLDEPSRRSGRRRALVAVVLLLAGIAGAVALGLTGEEAPAPPPPTPVPEGVQEEYREPLQDLHEAIYGGAS